MLMKLILKKVKKKVAKHNVSEREYEIKSE